MNVKRGVLAVGLSCLMMGPAWAARTPLHEAAESPEYGRKFGGMIGRGLLNASTCFMDLLVNLVTETKNGPPLVGTLVGIGQGSGCTVLRALSGVVDVATFWVPGFNGFPVSDSYENCLAIGGLVQAQVAGPASTLEPEIEEPSLMGASPAPASPPSEKPRYTK